jgi:hypothetical protein
MYFCKKNDVLGNDCQIVYCFCHGKAISELKN